MRRILFLIIIPIHFIVGLPWLGLVYLVGVFNMPLRRKMAYRFNRLTSWWLYTIAGAKIVIKGEENLPKDTTVLYVSNHTSMLDIPLMMLYIKDCPVLIGKDSIKKWPFIGWWLHAMGGFFLNRTSPKEGLKTILAAIERIKAGDSCIIYPEGTRSKTDEMLPFKLGSFKLATKPNVPIIPIAILGTADVFENNGFNLKPETVYFTIGEAIYPDQLPKEELKNIAGYTQEIVQEMYSEQLALRDAKNK